ncbi:MAG: peptidase domain-containing ABC transporter [Bacteroidales bacterium]|jgi:ATP-binding cassette subfamily B protein|nr:peptidase domain-containing ABC transporter [Bacteroidales bacterium]
MGFTFYHQYDSVDCGPACLQMISRHYGKKFRLTRLRELCYITRDGVSLLGISDAAESLGFRVMGAKLTFEQLVKEAPLPCIVHWNQRHFVVVYAIRQNHGNEIIYIADPAHGKIKLRKEVFLRSWLSGKDFNDSGICLLLEPTSTFHELPEIESQTSRFRFLIPYLKPRRKAIFQLILAMVIGSVIQFAFPFLTQAIVDKGIHNHDIGFIMLVLLGQLALFLGLTTVEFVRGWILLHLSTRINISMVSGFLGKIMKLPIGFFNTKMVGDLMQRITDHQRIQSFMTVSTLNVLFSTVTFILFSVVLLVYNAFIFTVFIAGSVLYAIWVYLFMKRRRELDYHRFSRMVENQNTLVQLITGMQEIKLYNSENHKRREWEEIQEKLYHLSIKSLTLNQYQSAGALFFARTKDILITFLSASLVIKGELTLGMMLAIQFILGQLNNPVEQMISFLREAQDAAISMERLQEINDQNEEEDPQVPGLKKLPENRDIVIRGLSFQYEGPHSPFVLKDLNLHIPAHRVTAIVGSSGSGKTTLIKLLLGFYKPVKGIISIGDIPLRDISCRFWRSGCGSVMQDGYLFSDTIANNIALSDDKPDEVKLKRAIYISNLETFIASLPMGMDTRIGQDGSGISEGQKQRILIARAVYRDPEYLFFDEATNSLDAGNERTIIRNLDTFFKGKTAIIVAHRLSTVRNANQIIVLEKGCIVEQGTHDELTIKRGAYWELVRNQLELG